MTLTLADLWEGLYRTTPGGIGPFAPAPAGFSSVAITRFVIDSRQATPGSCFVALPGERTDGHRFIGDALARGAVAILAERVPDLGSAGINAQVIRPDDAPTALTTWQNTAPPASSDHPFTGLPVLFQSASALLALQGLAAYWRMRHHPVVIGITGSVGKTSSKELTAAVLHQRYPTLWNEGNLNNEIGLPLTLLRLEPTHEYAVLEMGFYVEGEIAELCRLAQPHIGVITNIAPVHLERAGSMEAIFRGKAELVQALPATGHAILNWDDQWVQRMAPLSAAPVFRYGLTDAADLWADEISSAGLAGIRFRLHHRTPTGVDDLTIHLPLLGRHSVHTALRATAVGLLCGMVWEDIIRGLQNVNAQLRIEVTPGITGSTLIDDTYNASPPSTIAALNLLAEMAGRKLAVLGDMLELGEYAETGHRLVGRRAADVVHTLVAVGPLARWMAEEAAGAGLPAGRLHWVQTATEAEALLKALIAPGDYILIKGSRALGLENLVTALTRTP